MPRKKSNVPKKQGGKSGKRLGTKTEAPVAETRAAEPENAGKGMDLANYVNASADVDSLSIAQSLKKKLEEMNTSERRTRHKELIATPNAVIQLFNEKQKELTQSLNTAATHKDETKRENADLSQIDNEQKEVSVPNNKTALSNTYFQQMTEHMQRVNEVFYDLAKSEKTLAEQSETLIEKNGTLTNLCRTLQSENKEIHDAMREMQAKEKEWRDAIQAKFDQSLVSIREGIAQQETEFNEAAKANDAYRRRINHLIDHEKQRSLDFEKYRDEISQIEKLQDVEKSGVRRVLEKSNEQMHDLTTKLANSIQSNVMLDQRCTEFELKFVEITEAIKNSNECIAQFQEMKKAMLKQNKEFRQNKKDLTSKYTQLNAFNEITRQSCDTINRKNDTLENLCKNLQQQNDALKDCLKLHAIELNPQGSSQQQQSPLDLFHEIQKQTEISSLINSSMNATNNQVHQDLPPTESIIATHTPDATAIVSSDKSTAVTVVGAVAGNLDIDVTSAVTSELLSSTSQNFNQQSQEQKD